MGQDTTVTILGSLSLVFTVATFVFLVLVIEWSRKLKRYRTLLTLTRASRGKFNLADFRHNLTYGGQIPLSEEQAICIAENIPVDDSAWDSEDELTDDGIANANLRRDIAQQSFQELRDRLVRNRIKTAIQDKTNIEQILQNTENQDLLKKLQQR